MEQRKISQLELLELIRSFFRQNPFLDFDSLLEEIDQIRTEEQERVIPEYKPIEISGLQEENTRTVDSNIERKRREVARDESTYYSRPSGF
ncbi:MULTISPECIES: hypothetical protein [Lactobacillaceae]|uniref:Uncharacterized protein n=1 Tax=Ligilactobacillus murinus TaxID=1622 RepID=A0A4Q2AM44_9LACO|nr:MULTISPECIES: hypothetical protein [Lactobacillaceae]RXV70698.1 hypothetical protein D6C19_07670 [Ligilactobacillus murinus]